MAGQIRTTTSPIAPGRQIELVMTTGDNTDNTQCNETRWMIDALDGRTTLTPDSGLLAGQALGGSGCAVGPPAPAVPTPPTCTARHARRPLRRPRGGHEYYEPDASEARTGPATPRARARTRARPRSATSPASSRG